MFFYFILQFAAHHEIKQFYEVSAKTGENVTEAFEAFFKDVHRKVSTSPVASTLLITINTLSGLQCICSTQSENLRDLQIALRNLRILRTEANLQIACAICRLRNNARARSEDAAGTAVL